MAASDLPTATVRPVSPLSIAIDILAAPSEAFSALEQRPSKLFPLLLVVICAMLVMFWYFSIIDFDWYIDDTLATTGNLSEQQLESAREAMQSMSQSVFKVVGVLGSTVSILILYVLQSGYLSLVSALNGDKYRFSHWFSLICWTNIPYLLSIIGMVVTILLSPNGQISAYDLNPLTLANLGMTSSNGSVQSIMNVISLNLLWSLGLVVLAYRQWLNSSWGKTLAVVLSPYLVILGVWAYFAFA